MLCGRVCRISSQNVAVCGCPKNNPQRTCKASPISSLHTLPFPPEIHNPTTTTTTKLTLKVKSREMSFFFVGLLQISLDLRVSWRKISKTDFLCWDSDTQQKKYVFFCSCICQRKSPLEIFFPNQKGKRKFSSRVARARVILVQIDLIHFLVYVYGKKTITKINQYLIVFFVLLKFALPFCCNILLQNQRSSSSAIDFSLSFSSSVWICVSSSFCPPPCVSGGVNTNTAVVGAEMKSSCWRKTTNIRGTAFWPASSRWCSKYGAGMI